MCRRARRCRPGPGRRDLPPRGRTTHLDPVDGAIECAVERVVFQGGMSEYQLRLGPTLLRTVVHPSVSAQAGDRAWIAIQPERCILFAA